MSKYDFDDIVTGVQATIKDKSRKNQFGKGDKLKKVSDNPDDYVVMPEWFEQSFGALGLPFGQFVQISGKPDSGKTTLTLEAIRNAQEQDHFVIYIETEGKTSPDRLISAGVDPSKMVTITSTITEQVFDSIFKTLDVIKDKYPDAKILLAIDSYGNTTSQRDAAIDFTSQVGMVGGSAKTNRSGLNALRARQQEQNIAVLIVNYSYANIGSVGETNAGGRALEFFCSLIINAGRKGDLSKQVKGVKMKTGIKARWKISKNHWIAGKEGDYPTHVTMQIDGNGMKRIE